VSSSRCFLKIAATLVITVDANISCIDPHFVGKLDPDPHLSEKPDRDLDAQESKIQSFSCSNEAMEGRGRS
jgi:hypothetical protein